MVLKKHQNPKGGLNEAGREFYKRTEGQNLKAPLKTGNSGRRASFLARMGNMPGPSSKEDAKAKAKAISARNKK
jgi:hypothetical protein